MAQPTATLPADRYLEDYIPGAVYDCGTVTVTEQEIIDFARVFDPQLMHVDREAAAAGPFGEVIASGWHTISVMMRLFVDHFLPLNGLASPGIDEVRWLRPVRPNDTLRIRVSVLATRRSQSKPDRGLMHNLVEVTNQNNEIVLTMKPMNLVRCRPESLAPSA